MNRDRLLAAAKARALALLENYKPAEPKPLRLPGATGRAAMKMAVDAQALMGRVTPHDAVVCEALARTLSGGGHDHTVETSEEEVLRLEREAFMALLKTPGTLARVEHMLETGRPLRN
jgi:3-hydroxyacyl-CoA dehydrogenase